MWPLIAIMALMEGNSLLQRGVQSSQNEKQRKLQLELAGQQREQERSARAMLIDKMAAEERFAQQKDSNEAMRASLLQGTGTMMGMLQNFTAAASPAAQMPEPMSIARELGL